MFALTESMGSCSADCFTCFLSEVITMWTRSSGHSESFTNVSPAIFLFPCLFPVPSDSIQSLRTDRTPQLFASFQKFSLYCLKSLPRIPSSHQPSWNSSACKTAVFLHPGLRHLPRKPEHSLTVCLTV